MEFKGFKTAIQRQFNEIKKHDVFRVVVDKDTMWDLYLRSFPEGTNPIFRERTEHDCNCCKNFIRNAGSMVAIIDGKLATIWDVEVDSFYQKVADSMGDYIRSLRIESIFLHPEANIGVNQNFENRDDGVHTWNHLFIQLPSNLVERKDRIGSRIGESNGTHQVFLRALKEITLESVDTVLELIDQGSLYRGTEYKATLEKFRDIKKFFSGLNGSQQDDYCWWSLSKTSGPVTNIRNSAIGTLLVDLCEGKDLEYAVKAFETKVAPTNYKRPTALITQGMINKAKEKLEELGLTSALDRRFAVIEDISINNVLFADRTAKKRMDSVFDELTATKSAAKKKIDKIEEIHIEEFIKNVIPSISSMEIMFENKHNPNLVSLIAPCDLTAKNLFKWNNPFSWSYTGDVTDSIKERVKEKGGNVEGDLRCSLSWFNYDDLDLHMTEPNGFNIYYGNKMSRNTFGNLDVDMNAVCRQSRSSVENIAYPKKSKMIEGIYKLVVNQFSKRETIDVGFDAEIEFDDIIHSFHYPKDVKSYVEVAQIEYTKANGFKILKSIPSTQAVREVWGIPTNTFHKVSIMMLSPNYWDSKAVGNKHYFFMMEGCTNDKARGFYNEFLTEELNEHRKVFEVVGSKMKTDESINQLSGLGFSSTQRNSVLCKVKGNFTRTVKIVF